MDACRSRPALASAGSHSLAPSSDRSWILSLFANASQIPELQSTAHALASLLLWTASLTCEGTYSPLPLCRLQGPLILGDLRAK